MACQYCFYNDESRNRSIKSYGMMSEETAHTLIDKALGNPYDTASFGFQGGEPTLSGLDFYNSFIDHAEKYCGRADYTLQTNGLILNKEWALWLKEHDFLVGISLDGSKQFHDHYRKDKNGRGTHNKVFNNAKLLLSTGVKINILVTVTKEIAENAKEVYSLLKRNGFGYLQFIPLLDSINDERGSREYSLTPESYADFLIALFREYHKDLISGNYVSIRYFDNLIFMLLHGYAEDCTMNGRCGSYYTIEADGSVFPCDFYARDEYLLGNINRDDFDKLDMRRKEIGFIEKSEELDEECRTCHYYPLCRGGCKREREDFMTGKMQRAYQCTAYKNFFSKCLPALIDIAEREKRVRESYKNGTCL